MPAKLDHEDQQSVPTNVNTRVAFACEPSAPVAAHARKHFSQSCSFLLSAPTIEHLPPPDRAEVCFTGRSNVGKSSIINALSLRRKLARTSNTPGRTREVNLYMVADTHYLADLPGYGYARMPKSSAVRAVALLDSYISCRESLRRVFVLIDGRRGIMENDEIFMRRLDKVGVGFQVVATKLDKVRGKDRESLEQSLATSLATHPAAYPEVIATSAMTGLGIDALRHAITSIC